MLGSITPLGERGRGQRWGITASFFAAGSVAGGAALGGFLGAAGGLAGLGRGAWALGILAVAALAGSLLDRPGSSRRLPSTRRQVNEDWLGRYRGWVYGGAFGVQLGAGVFTVVVSSAVYLTFVAALLTGSAAWGGAIGGWFGFVRALPVLFVGRVRRMDQLVAVDRRLHAWRTRSGAVTAAAQVGLALFVVGLALSVAR